jgi:phosphate starvation-inducible PhoH-like protein
LKTAQQNRYSGSIKDAPEAETVTLEFENARLLQSLYGGDENLLRTMERRLGIQITTRDGWLKADGSAGSLARAKRTFSQLANVASTGVLIGRHEFLYALEKASSDNGTGLEGLFQERIQCSPRKPPVVPKSESQREYLKVIDSHDISFGIGPAGTGKTYLAVAKAVAALKTGKVDRIILTRPAVEAGEALGFLPGELQEKILPYLRPLYDALHEMLDQEEIQRAIERNIIEIAPLAYMRGRTLNKAFIILDEAQNTTTEQMFMFLTRIGIGSKCVLTGDRTQIDLPKNKPSGLIEAVGALGQTPGIAFHIFSERDVVRHPLVQAIVVAYKEHRGVRESRF